MSRALIGLVVALGVVACGLGSPVCTKELKWDELFACCSPSDLFNKTILEKCNSFMEKDVANASKTTPCFFECALNATEILSKPLELDAAKLKAYLNETFAADNKDLQPLFEVAFTKCVDMEKEKKDVKKEKKAEETPAKDVKETKETKEVKENKDEEKKVCKPCASNIVQCVRMEVALNCPAGHWGKGNDKCTGVRDSFKGCKLEVDQHEH